jgi:hypothetical protein
MRSIIQRQSIELGNHFEAIKEKIQTDDYFSHLDSISSFDPKNKTITFKTEKIYPIKNRKNQTPILMVFSNPHPRSVKSGMFLSEPHSRSFWERLLSCNCMQPNKKLRQSVSNWGHETIDILRENLLTSTYSNKVSLYFDCLESMPTNQYSDLKKIFTKEEGKELRKNTLQIPGMENLIKVSNEHNINSWIVFSAEAYRHICKDKTLAKSAPDRIIKAIDENVLDKNDEKFWVKLHDLKNYILMDNKKITVYLTLIARRKNWKNKLGEYYFTVMLYKIFSKINENKDN